MRNNSEEFAAYITHLQADHRRLQETITDIEEQWNKFPLPRPDVILHVLQDLEVLRSELSQHFENEEAGGCLEEAISRHPSLGPDANRLEHEHPLLLRQLDALISKLKGMAKPLQDLQIARGDFDEFAKRLRDHESAECRILEQSFSRPIE
jgi:hypothetical protein